MKKFLFSVVALVCFSLSSFANESKSSTKPLNLDSENLNIKPDWCVTFNITWFGDDADESDNTLATFYIVSITYCSED